MDDIYKICGGAIIGFLLSPFSEIIKAKIVSRQHKSKVFEKLKTYEGIIAKAIPTMESTIKQRDLYISNPEDFAGAFIIPNLNFPNIESNVDAGYSSLSAHQRQSLQVLQSLTSHLLSMSKKIVNVIDDMKEKVEGMEIVNHKDLHKIESLAHRKAKSIEVAMLSTARHIPGLITAILEDSKPA